MKKIFLLLLFVGLLDAKDVYNPPLKVAQKITIGAVENVSVIDANTTHNARIDTGARITSLHATNIKKIYRDGLPCIAFDFFEMKITAPYVSDVEIKRHGTSPSIRPVVMMNLRLGNVTKKIEVSLTDRSKFDYSVLIGRNFLNGDFVVDVVKQ